jgi:hypothetical protein
MTNSLDHMKDYVLNTVADDYENFDIISTEVAAWAAKEGDIFSKELLATSISQLINDGVVNCYRFSTTNQKYEFAQFEQNKLNELWFYISEEGKKHLE